MQKLTLWQVIGLLVASFFLQAWMSVPPGEVGDDPRRQLEQAGSDRTQTVELSLPDLQTLPPYDLRLILSQAAGRKWIRFSNSILNNGPGVLELEGARSKYNGDIQVTQTIYFGEDQSVQNLLGTFEFEESHNHWHFESFSLYEVWRLDPAGQPVELMASSGKVSYCVRDSDPVQQLDANHPVPEGAPDKPVYLSCGWTRQGLSPGWVDTYKHNTPGQYVDISGLPDGEYLLVSTVDPEDLLVEADETNNVATLNFTLSEDQVVMGYGQVLSPQAVLKPAQDICRPGESQFRAMRLGPRVRRPLLTALCNHRE